MGTFIAKSSAMVLDSSNACSSISPRPKLSRHINSPRKLRHPSEIKADCKKSVRNSNTETLEAQAEDTVLYGNEFKDLYDGSFYYNPNNTKEFMLGCLSLIHICRCRRYAVCRSRWSPYH
eukprot:TRINITY_DN17215_c0_g1_i1.p1 TRINITY_DN17215_c0_g1~~TRINITY_DN17215_c0_g1_i1.p1  ORF type:complete len:120 (-),score=10.06 TRINITY_DN17215_c0_g1_i1:12-371(-)